MIDSAYSLIQVGHAVLAGGIVLYAGRKWSHLIGVGALAAYWLFGSIAQEVFHTLTPSAVHFVLALCVFIVMVNLTRKAERKPFLYIATIFAIIMFLDTAHYATVWLSDSLPTWNEGYKHSSAFLYHLSLFLVWATAIREKQNEPDVIQAR